MESLTTTDDLLRRAEATAANHQPYSYFYESKKRGHTIIISCMDPRVVPEKIFNLRSEENEAAVIRNLAGHPQTALTAVLALDAVFGGFKQIIILHHTDCGSTYFTEEGVREKIHARCPGHPEVDEMRFGAVTGSLEDDLREDVRWMRSRELLPAELREKTRGFMYDVKTGKVTEVDV